MNVASLEQCKELYELSGWLYEEFGYHEDGHVAMTLFNGRVCPAYPLGFLLRKLHPYGIMIRSHAGNQWVGMVDPDYIVYAETPEDALCKLAIELIKRGILKEGG